MAARSIHTNDADLSTYVASLATEDLQKLAKSLQDQLTASKVQDSIEAVVQARIRWE